MFSSFSLPLMSRGFNWPHHRFFLSYGTTVHGAEPAPPCLISLVVVRVSGWNACSARSHACMHNGFPSSASLDSY
ncbi:hypothetical protein J3F84DRAFT_391654 [Trichoderma pleuroticola]